MPDSDTQVAAPVRPVPPLVEGQSAWIGADRRNREAEWSYRLSSPEVAEIEAAVRQVRARRLDIAEIRRDPVRFSFSHGGKDRHPFPVPLRVYDETIRVLKSAVQKAKLGREEELGTLKRLDDQARQLEHHASGPGVQDLIAQEQQRSPLYGGRSVFGWERDQAPAKIGNIDDR